MRWPKDVTIKSSMRNIPPMKMTVTRDGELDGRYPYAIYQCTNQYHYGCDSKVYYYMLALTGKLYGMFSLSQVTDAVREVEQMLRDGQTVTKIPGDQICGVPFDPKEYM